MAENVIGPRSPGILSKKTWSFLVLLALLILWILANWWILKRYADKEQFAAVKHLYRFNTIYVPLLLMLGGAFLLLPYYLNKQRIYLTWCIGLILAAVTIFGLRLYATGIEPKRMVVRHIALPSEKLSKPLRIVHVSDIQSAGIGDYEKRVFEKIRALQPDLVLFSGDYLQPIKPATASSELPKLLTLVSGLQPTLGYYSVFGETDADLKDIPLDRLSPLHVLDAEKVYLKNGPDKLAIFGMPLLTSIDQEKAKTDVTRAFLEDAPDTFKIVMGHHPTYAKTVGNLPVDLCLAGHTHGGQICVPLYGPLFVNCNAPRQWSRGFHDIGQAHLNVSAGVGCTHFDAMPSIRFYCPPEITVIDVIPVKTEDGKGRMETGGRRPGD